MVGNLAWKARVPERCDELRRCLLAHVLDHIRCRNKAGARKTLKNCAGAEGVIAVAVRGIDRGQILATGFDPFGESTSFFDAHQGINEDRVSLPVDERPGENRQAA